MESNNGFDAKTHFFVIDSECLDQIRSRLYGYTIINHTLVENDSLPLNTEPTANGAYVYVKRQGGRCIIKQDFLGSYGLYLYRWGEYFAISNSFLMLAEHVKKNHTITFNRDYARFFLGADLCSVAFSETMINEIELVDRSAVIEIDIVTKTIHTDYHDWGENTIELDSEEGFRILDQWYDNWTHLIRNLKEDNASIQVDLTGGFDSRMVFMLMLGSGIDLSDVFICAARDKLHTHAEDFEIASQICDYYGITLNNSRGQAKECGNYTLEEILSISFYLKLCFHKQLYFCFSGFEKRRHLFGGHGGECIREYWNMSVEDYVQSATAWTQKLLPADAAACKKSITRLLHDTFDEVRKKYLRIGRPVDPAEMTWLMYKETRARHHFGKTAAEFYLGGSVLYTPLLDLNLQRLKRNTAGCDDGDLLMAVILSRYQPDLLRFKFDSNRFIAPATIAYAEQLNRKYPYTAKKINVTTSEKTGCDTNYKVPMKNDLPRISQGEVNQAIARMLDTPRVKCGVEQACGAGLLNYVNNDIKNRKYFPLQSAVAAIGIAAVAQDCVAGETLSGKTHIQLLQEALGSGENGTMDTLWNHPYLENYIAARIDIKNTATELNDLEFIRVSDENARIIKPKWLADYGHGYVIDSTKGVLRFSVRCIHAGKLEVALRGRDIRNAKGERIPFWIDLHSLCINGEEQLRDVYAVWHDAPLKISRSVGDGEIVNFDITWGPMDQRRSN